jgi:prophage antirepressor-like protein
MKSNAPASLKTNDPSQQILSLQSFLNDQVRIIGTADEPWFVASDVAKILDITNSRNMTSGLDDDQRRFTTVDTLGGEQSVVITTESAL